MRFTKSKTTIQTGFQSFLSHSSAEITHNLRFIQNSFLEVIYNLSECCIDLEFWSLGEFLFTEWTVTLLTVTPACFNTFHAEVVSTWSGDWISEHIQTDRTQELIFRQETTGVRSNCG